MEMKEVQKSQRPEKMESQSFKTFDNRTRAATNDGEEHRGVQARLFKRRTHSLGEFKILKMGYLQALKMSL